MGKARTGKSLPENAALSADQQLKFTEKLEEVKKKVHDDEGPTVVYIGHIPHGFFEEEMKQYFSQFGYVRQVRLSRSKKTGNSKGYAFVKFASAAVAQIVADSMHNYLMFNKLLQCKLIPNEEVHPNTFKSNEGFKPPIGHLVSLTRHNRQKSTEQNKRSVNRSSLRIKNTLKKLKDNGIDYKFSKKDVNAFPALRKPAVKVKAKSPRKKKTVFTISEINEMAASAK